MDLTRLFIAIGGGAAIGLATPDPAGALLACAGLLGLVASQGGQPLPDALRAAVAGLVWYAIALSWFPEAWTRFAASPSFALFVLLIAVQALLPVLASLIGSAGRARGLSPPVAAACAWALASGLAEAFQPLPADPSLFLAGGGPLLWPLAVGGRPLLVGGLAGLAAWSLTAPRAAAAAFGLWLLVGAGWALAPNAGGESVRIGIAQPGTGAFDARRASTAPARAERLRGLLTRLGDAALVVTPEGAWPFDPGEPESAARTRFLADWTRGGRALPPTLLGATVGGEPAPTNSLLLVREGAVHARYDKQRLVPLAEQARLGLGRDRYRVSDTPAVLDTGVARIGVMLCYEDLFFASLARAASGSELLVSATNDAWLGQRQGSRLHLAASLRAAVEARRWVVRSTANGRSALLDPGGRRVWSAEWVDGDLAPDAPPQGAVLAVPRLRPLWDGTRGAPLILVFAAGTVLVGRRPRRPGTPA